MGKMKLVIVSIIFFVLLFATNIYANENQQMEITLTINDQSEQVMVDSGITYEELIYDIEYNNKYNEYFKQHLVLNENQTVAGYDINVTGIMASVSDDFDYTDEIMPGDEVELIAEITVNVLEEAPIPYATITNENPDMQVGTSTVVQEGKDGNAVYTNAYTFEGGEPSCRTISRDVQHATPEIIEVGTATGQTHTTSTGESFVYSEKMSMEATAYTQGDAGVDGITATGAPVQEGVVAVDTDVIPYGTEMYVEGYGYAVAADTGGAIDGNEIDLYFDTYDECIQFGRQQVDVYILE